MNNQNLIKSIYLEKEMFDRRKAVDILMNFKFCPNYNCIDKCRGAFCPFLKSLEHDMIYLKKIFISVEDKRLNYLGIIMAKHNLTLNDLIKLLTLYRKEKDYTIYSETIEKDDLFSKIADIYNIFELGDTEIIYHIANECPKN